MHRALIGLHMSGPAKTTKTKATGPAVVPFVLAAVQPPPAKDPPAENPSAENAPPPEQDSVAKTDSPPVTGKTTLLSFEGVAVLALGEAGEILAARDACLEVFGWETTALVGQNIRVLLKGGLDNDVGRFLHRHRAGKNPTGTIALRVWGTRKDGTEFPAQVTTLTWNWGPAVTTKGDVSRLCWTAAFRDLSAATTLGQATSKEGSPTAENGSEPPELGMAEDANQPAPPSTPTDIPPSSPEPTDR